jgi:hypothetical protein
MAEGRGGLLSAGGILSIIVGVFELIIGGIMVALMWIKIPFWPPSVPGFGGGFTMALIPTWLIIVGIVLAVLGIVAIVGGSSAIRRGNFGLSLAGAICALLPINILGILAVIFVALAKREFE